MISHYFTHGIMREPTDEESMAALSACGEYLEFSPELKAEMEAGELFHVAIDGRC